MLDGLNPSGLHSDIVIQVNSLFEDVNCLICRTRLLDAMLGSKLDVRNSFRPGLGEAMNKSAASTPSLEGFQAVIKSAASAASPDPRRIQKISEKIVKK